jgi:cystathionine beta-lyase family protein involved in aluminum resistance
MIDAILGGRTVDPAVHAAAERALPRLYEVDPRRGAVRMRVIDAFLAEGIAESDLAGTTGYGYDDLARIFGAERVLARLSIVSGTHAIVAALDALLPHGARLLAVNGAPYDTLRYALVDAPYSLVASGARYAEVERTAAGDTDLYALAAALQAEPAAVAFVQRSRGYADRRSLSIDAIAAIVDVVRAVSPETIVFVDNCYGELVEEREPLAVGADVLAGSLIKNVGGGLAPTGGYIAGRSASIERIAARIFAPGIGAGLGPMLGLGRTLVQGLFYAPLVIGETLRGLQFAAALFAELGYGVDPLPDAVRTDIVQAIRLGSREKLIAFARGLQTALPINARFAPEPGPVPGYIDPVIMSSGSFVSGSTIDLSCDAPLRAPWDVYLQGGIVAEHVALGAMLAADAVSASNRDR